MKGYREWEVSWCAKNNYYYVVFFFFFQAEDGIRDYKVTGVQTCALPIYCCRALGGYHATIFGLVVFCSPFLCEKIEKSYDASRTIPLFGSVCGLVDNTRAATEKTGIAIDF